MISASMYCDCASPEDRSITGFRNVLYVHLFVVYLTTLSQ
jgi:hypothetical protein